jgi:hypothetical protein
MGTDLPTELTAPTEEKPARRPRTREQGLK